MAYAIKYQLQRIDEGVLMIDLCSDTEGERLADLLAERQFSTVNELIADIYLATGKIPKVSQTLSESGVYIF